MLRLPPLPSPVPTHRIATRGRENHRFAAGRRPGLRWLLSIVLLGCLAATAGTRAATITVKDGRRLEGRIGSTQTVAEDPLSPDITPGGVDVQSILIVDDGLRRTFISKRRVINTDPTDNNRVKVEIGQRVADVGSPVGTVGGAIRVTELDEYGRRIFEMTSLDGPLAIVQGITEITPVYTRLQALMGQRKPFVWDMRIATSSIPRETLSKILRRAIPDQDPQARLRIVQLYLQSERYRDARFELEQVIKDFPDLEGLDAEVRELRQVGARRALSELELRADAGQHEFVEEMLRAFPADEVAGETLQQVREMLDEYGQQDGKLSAIKTRFTELAGQIEADATRQRVSEFSSELLSELNLNTLDRMGAFLQLEPSETLTAEEKVSLAITGWLLGSRNADEKLPLALSLLEVRDLVRQYLSAPTQRRQAEILDYLAAREAATVEQVAQLLALMRPPLEMPPLVDETVYGFYRQSVPGLHQEPDVDYYVQLPPQYDPYRRYPTIVTLNGAGSTAIQQLDFWAGSVQFRGQGTDRRGSRLGQSMRHGYITISIDWRKPHQYEYEFSAREHHAVMSVVRDAARRFSIDTDRTYLTGHDIGGDMAWDIALSHPDAWAGVIPIVARSRMYCTHYWKNAEFVPLYFVCGEKDANLMKINSRDLDRFLRRGWDTTVVEYLGRGHESFNDEIQRLFDWMNRRRRNFFPQEFTCSTMRSWDNYFWWVELNEIPANAVVHPIEWPPPRNMRPWSLRATSVRDSNSLNVRTGTPETTVWLSPEIIDFDKRASVTINGRRVINGFVKPDLAVLLEDARARAERQHPFWAKVDAN